MRDLSKYNCDEIRLLKEEMRTMQEQFRVWMNRYWVERGLPEI